MNNISLSSCQANGGGHGGYGGAPGGGAPAPAPGGAADYSAQWIEYYRSVYDSFNILKGQGEGSSAKSAQIVIIDCYSAEVIGYYR